MQTQLLEHDEVKPLLISLLIFGVLMGCFVWYETGKTTRETLKQENIALAQAGVKSQLLFGRPGKFPSIATRYEIRAENLYFVESYVDVPDERKPYFCFVVNDQEHVREAPACGFDGQEIQKNGIYVARSCGYTEIPRIDKPTKYSFDNILQIGRAHV